MDIASDSQLEYTFTNSVECMMSNLHNQIANGMSKKTNGRAREKWFIEN